MNEMEPKEYYRKVLSDLQDIEQKWRATEEFLAEIEKEQRGIAEQIKKLSTDRTKSERLKQETRNNSVVFIERIKEKGKTLFSSPLVLKIITAYAISKSSSFNFDKGRVFLSSVSFSAKGVCLYLIQELLTMKELEYDYSSLTRESVFVPYEEIARVLIEAADPP